MQQGTSTGHWSNHAYGLAVDINPVENPYVGCGMTRDKKALSYLDRSRVRKGWSRPPSSRHSRLSAGVGRIVDRLDEDYMHFSHNGH